MSDPAPSAARLIWDGKMRPTSFSYGSDLSDQQERQQKDDPYEVRTNTLKSSLVFHLTTPKKDFATQILDPHDLSTMWLPSSHFLPADATYPAQLRARHINLGNPTPGVQALTAFAVRQIQKYEELEGSIKALEEAMYSIPLDDMQRFTAEEYTAEEEAQLGAITWLRSLGDALDVRAQAQRYDEDVLQRLIDETRMRTARIKENDKRSGADENKSEE